MRRIVEDLQRKERELGLRVVHGAPRKPATTVLRTIYVYLLDEGTDVWRPVDAVHVAGDVYRIVSRNRDPEDERWQFVCGAEVVCEERELSGGLVLVAVRAAPPS